MEKVSFWIETPLTDLITGDETGAFQTPITPVAFMNANIGTYWIETDRNGELYLCKYATKGVACFIDCTDANGVNPYSSFACSFVGGRPNVSRPIHK